MTKHSSSSYLEPLLSECETVETYVEGDYWMIETINGPRNKSYGNNQIRNSKYRWWSFLPLILWAHLRRFMNVYFLFIGGLQHWRDVSVVNPLTAWIPIIVIFAVAFFREGIDDYHVHQQDKAMNNRKFRVSRNRAVKVMKSEDIMCGDLVILHKDEEAPCDFVLLWSSNPKGVCFIETANLNGETALKERRSPPLGLSSDTSQLENICVRYVPPRAPVYEFDGFLKLGGWDTPGSFRVGSENFIPAGTHIKNTEQVIGCACYTGKNTKLGLNSKPPPVKWTRIEKFVDKASLVIFLLQIVIAIVFGAIGNWQRGRQKVLYPYLRQDLGETLPESTAFIILYVRLYLLASVMIPISLKVTIDLLKYVYAIWIRNDAKMRSKDLETLVNNTSIIEDLGCVEYIFSDKTGTMTENEMTFKKIAVRGDMYGHSEYADDIRQEPGLESVMSGSEGDEKREWLSKFITALSVCHSVKILRDANNSKSFEGFSPEEVSFLTGLADLGVEYTQEEDVLTFESERLSIPRTSFRILQTIPFKEERKRMAVIAKDLQTGQFYLFSKGAHETMACLCGDTVYPEYERQSDIFTTRGLRVMAVAFREITKQQFESFRNSVDATNEILNLQQRNMMLEDAYSAVEEGQTVIGLVGIEDKLQEGVPETIAMLREAGIRVWMVTGDAPKTAVNIAKSTKLLGSNGVLIELTKSSQEDHLPKYTSDEILDRVFEWVNTSQKDFYLLIDGTSPLAKEFLEDGSNRFKVIASKAKSVICARTTPKQKAKYVECIQSMKKMTLAIGDGGNDVTMIHRANIGIGIMGKEGRQAALASDIAISEFRHLQRLLLIHGRYDSYRTSWLTQFCFYKSIVLVIVQLGYMFWNGFSAISFISDFNLMTYNAVFTLFPVILFLVDKDLDEESVFLHPYVYSDTRLHTFCNIRTLFWWIMRGIWQGVMIVLVVHFSCTKETVSYDGGPMCTDEAQQIAYSILILNVIITTTFDSKSLTSLNFIFVWGNWIIYFVLACLAGTSPPVSVTRKMYLTVWRSFSNPLHWMIVVTGVALCILPVILVQSLFALHLPTRTQQLREWAINKHSQFQDPYEIDLSLTAESYIAPPFYTEKHHRQTIWDKTHNICSPLVALCGC